MPFRVFAAMTENGDEGTFAKVLDFDMLVSFVIFML
jgi:hypothetical protein